MSEATKHDAGKNRVDLVAWQWVQGVAQVLTFGAQKYHVNNWAKGMAWSRVIRAAKDHIGKWADGEDLDDESGLSHLLHASCCLMFLYMYEKHGLGTDDRYKWLQDADVPEEELLAMYAKGHES